MRGKKAEVVVMPGAVQTGRKVLRCRQEEVDAVPFGSGDWTVADVPGLVLRAGARKKTWRLQRRVQGKLVTRVLGEMTAAEARRLATKLWQSLKPAPAEGKLTLEQAWGRFLEERPLAEKTRFLYQYNLDKYLAAWKDRPLEKIGEDRAGVRSLCLHLQRNHGKGLASQVMRQLRAVYQYWRRVLPDLPESPTIAVDIPSTKPRDWALSPGELRQWWEAVKKLSPVKRTFWLTLLLTGARRDSVRLLKWKDCDFERKVIRFSAAKGGRTYAVPMSERLARILARWREECAPGEWAFESPRRPGQPLSVQVRDDKRGVASAHHLRHTYRTVLAELGATPDQARLLLGHSLSGDVSRGYITPHLLVESLRPLADAVAEKYAAILGWEE